MKQRSQADGIIKALEQGDVYAECPCCSEPIRLRDAGLFHLDDMTPAAEEVYQQRLDELKEREREIRERRKAIPERSQRTTRAVNIGFVLERLAPSMDAFPFEHTDCRSLFDPIDYVIFEGLSRHAAVNRIIFADIKTGAARLQANQREIRTLVEQKQVEFDTYERKPA